MGRNLYLVAKPSEHQRRSQPAELLTLGTVASAAVPEMDRQHQLITLLAYLAIEGPTERSTLATLFWPRSNSPLNNLSSALTRIRGLAPDALIVDQRVVATRWISDAEAILRQRRASDLDVHQGYKGPFLLGLQLPKVGVELEEWIFDVRDRVRDCAVTSATNAAVAASVRGEDLEACQLAELAWHMDPGSEILAEAAQRLAPILSSRARPLARELRELSGVARIRPSAAPLMGVVGRELDLRQLVGLASGGRSVNVVGLAGSGKSTLLRLVGQQLEAGGRRVATVDACGEVAGPGVLARVAAALGCGAATSDAIGAIVQRIERDTVVVVDDVSNTADVAAALRELSTVVGAVVVSSRQKLDLASFDEYLLAGLRVRHESGQEGPAFELFRNGAGLDGVALSAVESELVESICRRVGGLPLAIRLTSQSVRLIGLAAVSQSLTELDSTFGERAYDDHTNLLDLIGQSWSRLSDDVQVAVESLSIFRGSFSSAAARSVARAGLGVLTEIHDVALLTSRSGALELHPLVRTFARRSLDRAPERRQAVADQHAMWFVDELINWAGQLRTETATEALEGLQTMQNDLEFAWQTICDAGDGRLMAQALPSIDQYLLQTGQSELARDLYSRARQSAAALDVRAPGLLAELMNNIAWVDMMLGNAGSAAALVDEGLMLPGLTPSTEIALWRTRCALLGNAGDADGAVAGYERARRVAEQIDDPYTAMLLEEDLGRAHALLGNHDVARRAFRSVLSYARSESNRHMEARSYLLLARSTVPQDIDHAMALFDEGEDLAIRYELKHLVAYFPVDRGDAQRFVQDFAAADVAYRDGLVRAEEVGERPLVVRATLGAARASLRLGDVHRARDLYRTGLRGAIDADSWIGALGAALEVVAMTKEQGRSTMATKKILHAVRAHPHIDWFDRVTFGIAHSADDELTHKSSGLGLDEMCELVLAEIRKLI